MEGLDKTGLLEVQGMIDKGNARVIEEISSLKDYVKENMVCVVDCGKRRGKINMAIVSVGFVAVIGLGNLAIKMIPWLVSII